MNYMGGKARQGPKIAEFVMKVWKPGMGYYEPFCGALGAAHRVVQKMIDAGAEKPEIHLSDINESVINMWQAVFNGWMPPEVVTEATYNEVKGVRDPKDPMTAFCGHGVSFGAKWFGGYARDGKGKTNFALNSRKSTLLKLGVMSKANVTFQTTPFNNIRPTGAVLYLDPPYAGRTKAHGHSVPFDHDIFWRYAEEMTKVNVVLVTEFIAPDDWVRVYSWGDTVVRHYSGKPSDGTNESIFVHESQLHLFQLNDSCTVASDMVQ